MKIKILGAGCISCKELHENVLKAVGDNKEISVEYITEVTALIEAGIMASPALLVDDKIVSVGRILSAEEVSNYIADFKKTCGSTCSCGNCC